MVKKLIFECDICGKLCSEKTIYVTVDRKMDGAGSMDDVCEYVDLCYTCTNVQLDILVRKMDYETAKEWYQKVSTKKKGY